MDTTAWILFGVIFGLGTILAIIRCCRAYDPDTQPSQTTTTNPTTTAQPPLNIFDPLSHPSGTVNVGAYSQNRITAQLPTYSSQNMSMTTRSDPLQTLSFNNPLNVVVLVSQHREELPPAYNDSSVSNAVKPTVIVETSEETNAQSDV
jgi:hypothetical protein